MCVVSTAAISACDQLLHMIEFELGMKVILLCISVAAAATISTCDQVVQ